MKRAAWQGWSSAWSSRLAAVSGAPLRDSRLGPSSTLFSHHSRSTFYLRRRLKWLVRNLPDNCLGSDGSDGSGAGALVDGLNAAAVEANWDDTVAKADSYSTMLFLSAVGVAGKLVVDLRGEYSRGFETLSSCTEWCQGIVGFACIFFATRVLVSYALPRSLARWIFTAGSS